MNSGYSRKLIWDYINGHYIENVEELENDCKFMMDIINITKDKNMYNLCSDEIKNNYEFITFMIDLFKDDIDFICKIANEYINTSKEESIYVKDIIFTMCELLEKYKDDEKYWIFFVKRAAIATVDRIMVTSIINEEEDLNIKKQLGLGFVIYLSNEYVNSRSMIKYVANMFLDEIFYENSELSIEELIHKRFSNKDKLDRYGIKNFIFTYVGEYDSFLATYLSANMDMISHIEKKIISIRNNWDKYVTRNLIRKNDIFMQESYHLIEEYNSRYTYTEICSYIDKLNIIPIKLETNFEDELETIDLKTIKLNDYICIKKIIQLAKELYLSPIIDTNAKLEKKINNNKILKFIPKRIEHKKNN